MSNSRAKGLICTIDNNDTFEKERKHIRAPGLLPDGRAPVIYIGFMPSRHFVLSTNVLL